MMWSFAPTAIILFQKQEVVMRQSFSSSYKIAELETFLWEKYFALGQKFPDEKWALFLFYLCYMMTAINTLNKSLQREFHTVIDFADKVRAFKEKLELWFIEVENAKFVFIPNLNRPIEDLDPEPNLMASVSFVILGDLHTLRKNFEKYIPENINSYT